MLGAAAALVIGISAIPSGGQTTPAPAGTTVTAVSGHASGPFVDVTIDDEFGAGAASVLRAEVPADADAAAAALAELGIAADGDVGALALVQFVTGPEPTVTLPPEGGGPFTDSLAQFLVNNPDEPFPLAGPISVSTQGAIGPEGFATSTATLEDVGVDDEGSPIDADLIDVECRSDLAGGPVGSTRFVNGVLAVEPPEDIEELPAPNTVLLDDEIEIPLGSGVVTVVSRVVANEQTVGAYDITVRGAHYTQTATFEMTGEPPVVVQEVEIIYGEIACGIVPGAVVEPTFTG